MKKFLPLLFVFFLSFAPVPKVITETLKSTVFIQVDRGEGTTSYCTGVVINPAQALTAEHCTKEVGSNLLVDSTVQRVVKKGKSLALVSIPTGKKPAVPIRKDEAQLGEEVTSFGFAWMDMMVLKGSIAGYIEENIIIDRSLAPGMSGGPIVDSDGKLVGINQGTTIVTSNGAGTKEIWDFLGRK